MAKVNFIGTLVLFILLISSLVVNIHLMEKKESSFGDWIWLSPEQHSIDIILGSFNGLDTVSLDFGDKSDILSFLPDGNGVGYIVYSEVNTNDHAVDYLSIQETKDFVYWLRMFPISGDDREKANEYYIGILDKYVYYRYGNTRDYSHSKND
jgi:hypothetical protein